MIQNITSKIMLGGICKYAKTFNTLEKEVQIRITNGEDESVIYEICENWQPKERVSFKDILNKKIDILGYEQLATPFLKKSLKLYNEQFEVDFENLSLFLFNRYDKVGVAVFNQKKNLKLLTLSNHFEQLGL